MSPDSTAETSPIYVAGLDRTGTSLMYALLASHPNIAMTRRTNLWRHFYDQFGDLENDQNLDTCVTLMRRYKRLVKHEIDWDLVRATFVSGDRTYGRLFDVIERAATERTGKPRWGDKSLHTERYFSAILDAFPNVRVLHMIRDPRDRFASSQTRWVKRRGGIGAGSAEWLESVELAKQNMALGPSNYMLVRYEELVTDPEDTLHRVCEFVGEDFVPEMLTLSGADDFAGSNSSYEAASGKAISTRSIGRYRTVLTSSQIRFIQERTRHEMAPFDYRVDTLAQAWPDRLRYPFVTWPIESLRVAAWRTMNSVRNRRGRPLPDYRLVEQP